MSAHCIKLSWFAGLVAALSLSATRCGYGQHAQPFTDFNINYDLQLFAPAVDYDLGDFAPAKLGFFATYDRVYMNMTRPETVELLMNDNVLDGDFTWGNRFDFGYLIKDEHGEHGWSLTVWDVRNRGETFTEDNVDGNGQLLPDVLGNPVGPEVDSINMATLSGVELNKVIRITSARHGNNVSRHGLTLEPFAGIRYARFKDFFRHDEFDTSVSPGATRITDVRLDRTEAVRENDMIGGQLGLRGVMRRGRWLLSSEFRAFAMHNFQTYNERTLTETQTDLTPLDTTPSVIFGFDDMHRHFTADAFVLGGELRVETAFEITRAIAVRVGLDVMEFAEGVGRGRNEDESENLGLAGVTFGFTINR